MNKYLIYIIFVCFVSILCNQLSCYSEVDDIQYKYYRIDGSESVSIGTIANYQQISNDKESSDFFDTDYSAVIIDSNESAPLYLENNYINGGIKMSNFMIMSLVSVLFWVVYFTTGIVLGLMISRKIMPKKIKLGVVLFGIAWPISCVFVVLYIATKNLTPIYSKFFNNFIDFFDKNVR